MTQPADDDTFLDDAGLDAMLRALREHPDALSVARIDDALRRWPGSQALRIAALQWLEDAGEGDALRARLPAARAAFPDCPRIALPAFRAALEAQDGDAAAELLRAIIWPSALPESVRRRALGVLVQHWSDPATLPAVLGRLLRDHADDRFVLVKLASLATRLRRHIEAAGYLEQAERLGALPAEAQSMRINMLALGGDISGSLALVQQQLAAHPGRKDLVRRANIVASIEGSQAEVTRTMALAAAQWPADASVIQRYNRVVLPEAEDERLFGHFATVAGGGAVDARWLYQFALACLRRQRTPRACGVLRALLGDGQVGFEARRLLGMLDTLPEADWDSRARFPNDATRDVRVVTVPDAEATIVAMAGLHGGLGSLPLSHLDVLLSAHPVNVVYLRDNRWAAFTRGVPGLGADEAATVAALAALCAGLGPVPVITFGGSLAGWAAMRYGALMGAQVALSLAGPTRLGAPAAPGARFAQHYLARMLPDAALDLPGLLANSPGLRVIHAYGGRNAKDIANAAPLRQIPHAVLVPVEPCEDHYVAAHLVAGGGFHPLIRQAIAAARAAAA